jgi:hypothetical protein
LQLHSAVGDLGKLSLPEHSALCALAVCVGQDFPLTGKIAKTFKGDIS